MTTVSLADVCFINPRLPAELATQKDLDVDFVPMANLSEDGQLTANGTRKLHEVKKGYTYFENGDVIVAKITPCLENGKAACVRKLPHRIGFGSTEFHVLRPKQTVDQGYLFHMIWSPYFRDQAARNMTGTAGQQRVPTSFVERFSIPLPPLQDQRRIAVILDKADDFRRKRKAAIDHFELLGASIFSRLFDEESRSAPRIPLHRLIDLRYGTSNKSAIEGKPTLRIPNVVNGVVDLRDLKNVPVTDAEFEKLRLVDGDVLFVRTNGNPNYIGRCAVFDEGELKKADHNPADFIYASYLIRGRLNRQSLNPLFLQHFLQTSAGRQALRDRSRTSAGQYNINTRGIGSIEIPSIPLERQEGFAAHIAALKPVRRRLGTAIDDADDLFNTLVQRAFRGKL